MGESALGLLLTAVLAVGIGATASVVLGNTIVASSEKAADQANSTDLNKPAAYGAK